MQFIFQNITRTLISRLFWGHFQAFFELSKACKMSKNDQNTDYKMTKITCFKPIKRKSSYYLVIGNTMVLTCIVQAGATQTKIVQKSRDFYTIFLLFYRFFICCYAANLKLLRNLLRKPVILSIEIYLIISSKFAYIHISFIYH